LSRRVQVGLAGIVILVVAGMVIIGRLSPENKVKGVVNHQLDLFNSGERDAVYATLTSGARQACPQATVQSRASGNIGLPGSEIELKGMQVRIEGGRAYVTGWVAVGGKLIFHVDDSDPLVYVNQRGVWLLDLNNRARAACASSSLGVS